MCNATMNSFIRSYPLGSDLRRKKLQTLLDGFQAQQSIFRNMVKSNDNVTGASFKLAWNTAKANKPATEGEFLTTTFIDCANSLLSDFKNKDDIIKQILKLQISDSTVIRRVEVISDNILSQLLKDIESAALFSLALDESTDRTDIGQLVVWVRFPKGDTFSYEMLSLLPLTNQTRGQDIHSAVTIFFMDQVKPST